jgi:hypothetical protein
MRTIYLDLGKFGSFPGNDLFGGRRRLGHPFRLKSFEAQKRVVLREFLRASSNQTREPF